MIGRIVVTSAALAALVATANDRVIHGEPVAPEEHQEVVVLKSDGARCTAVVVGPRVIITAAHCAVERAEFTVGEKTYSAKVTRSPLFPEEDHDVALGVTDVEIPVRPATIGGEPLEGQDVAILGYGCTEFGGGGGNDGVLRKGASKVSGTHNHDVVTKLAEGGALCFGDSGGPLYHAGQLLGVGSKGNIIDTSYFARTDTEASRTFFEAFAGENQVEICGINADCIGY
jgi:hypothetical protein